MKMTDEMCDCFFEDLPLDVKRWLCTIANEYERATEKHPTWPNDFIHASAIVAEECGELVRATLQHKYEGGQYYNMHTEAIQTGAMALRFLIETKELIFDEEGDGSSPV